MSDYYNKNYSRPRRQSNNYRNHHRNRYDDHQYNDYEHYGNNSQRFEDQQKQNQYNYYHSNVDKKKQYYNKNNNYSTNQLNQYETKRYNAIYNKYQNYDKINGYYYDDDDNDTYYENNNRHNEYDEYQYANHQNNNSISYGIKTDDYIDYKSRDKTRNIRDMNNWCKYVNITHSIREAYKINNNCKINMLDLGCGKGGDLYKCRGNKKYILKYLGIDLSNECIINARQKYSKILETNIIHRNATYEQRQKFGLDNAYGQRQKEFFDEPIFNAQFICDDMNSPSLLTSKLLESNKPFNLINIQFALHYSFQSKVSLLSLFNVFNKYIKYGTYFICSLARDDIIINRLKKNKNYNINNENICFQNEYQSIKMKKSDFEMIENIYNKYELFKMDINKTIYENENDNNIINDNICDKLIGIPYMYYQKDSVEGNNGNGSEEYLISFVVLCKLLWKYCKMKLIYKKTCCDIYIESSRVFPYKYGYSKGRELDNVKWSTDEQNVIDTYCYALFQRV